MSSVVPESPFSNQSSFPFSDRFNYLISLLWNSKLAEVDRLFAMGLNVFPQPYGKKEGFPWKELQYTRLNRSDLLNVFDGTYNLAVMMSRTSRNLFGIDYETEEAFKHHRLEAARRKLAVWVVKTARGGHLYFLCAEGEVQNIRPETIPDVESRGQNCYVLCPPSQRGGLHLAHPKRGRAADRDP
jgi:hypothetical protein